MKINFYPIQFPLAILPDQEQIEQLRQPYISVKVKTNDKFARLNIIGLYRESNM